MENKKTFGFFASMGWFISPLLAIWLVNMPALDLVSLATFFGILTAYCAYSSYKQLKATDKLISSIQFLWVVISAFIPYFLVYTLQEKSLLTALVIVWYIVPLVTSFIDDRIQQFRVTVYRR